MFRINSENELLQLLKIVSEEAVKKSRKTLNEAVDTAQERYMNNLAASEQTYGGLSEQEDEEPKKEAEPEQEEPKEAEPEEETNTSDNQEKVAPEDLGVSFDSVIKDINTLRAGRSTKDKEIKEELLGYYDRLDDDERKILHLFLSEISKILQGALTAADAQDPSDEPFNAEVTFGDISSEEPPETQRTGNKPQQTQSTQPKQSGEDTSPPIQVGEKGQNLQEIRIKVKNLMKRF